MRRAFVRLLVFVFVLSFSLFALSCSRVEDSEVQDTKDESMRTTIPATSFYDQSVSKYLGVEFIIENASPQGADIRLENKYGYDVLLGHGFRIVIMDGDEAVEYAEFKEGLGFAAIAAIPSGVPYLKERFLDFDYYFGGLEPGHYRFVTSVDISDDTSVRWPAKPPSDFEEVSLYADFVIG